MYNYIYIYIYAYRCKHVNSITIPWPKHWSIPLVWIAYKTSKPVLFQWFQNSWVWGSSQLLWRVPWSWDGKWPQPQVTKIGWIIAMPANPTSLSQKNLALTLVCGISWKNLKVFSELVVTSHPDHDGSRHWGFPATWWALWSADLRWL